MKGLTGSHRIENDQPGVNRAPERQWTRNRSALLRPRPDLIARHI
jgi:hypothetical protein